jgi:hypothetical protein
MHPLLESIDEFVGDCLLHGFGHPRIGFGTWEDGAVLMIRSGRSLDEARELDAETLYFILKGGVMVFFPKRDHSRGVVR